MTVYVDLLFVLNTVINYLLLRAGALIGGSRAPLWRLAAAAAVGGGYAVAAVLPGAQWLQHWFFQFLCAVLMMVTAFGMKKHTVKQALYFFAMSFAFSGAVLLLIQLVEPDCMFLGGRAYYAVSMSAMLLLAGVCYLLAALVLRGCGTHTGGDIIPVTLLLEDREVSLRALRDTGNTLRDPITGQNVLIVDGELLSELFPAARITAKQRTDGVQVLQQLLAWYPQGKFCLISYRAVGVQAGLLPAVRCRVRIEGKTQSLPVAFSPARLGDTFQALWGGKQL